MQHDHVETAIQAVRNREVAVEDRLAGLRYDPVVKRHRLLRRLISTKMKSDLSIQGNSEFGGIEANLPLQGGKDNMRLTL
jgi:hypothetical protein